MNTAQLKLVVGGVLLAGGLGYMVYLSAVQTGQYALGVAQFTTTKKDYVGRGLRLEGLVPKGSWNATGNHHTFRILDDKDQSTVIPVTFEGTMPDTFAEERQVIVAGKMSADGNTMVATEVIPQCASKYVPMGAEATKEYKKYQHAAPDELQNRPGFGGTPAAHSTPATSAANDAPATVTR
jgi:cytochrome c-type biogenesis protein CcmE